MQGNELKIADGFEQACEIAVKKVQENQVKEQN